MLTPSSVPGELTEPAPHDAPASGKYGSFVHAIVCPAAVVELWDAQYCVPKPDGTQYCAYHSTTTAAGHTIAWTNDPYLPDVGSSCGAGSVNSPGTLDGVSIVFGHEQGETETDPQPNTGWLDSGNGENGDKCAWTNLINNPNAGGYPTQPLWSNANNGCVQTY